MRNFFTSLFAFILSGLAGVLVVQELAVITGATEECILVFAATVMIVVVVTVGFFLVQFRGKPVACAFLSRAAGAGGLHVFGAGREPGDRK